jgi:type VI secretion system ImpM family protein
VVVPLPAAPVRAILFGKLPSHGDFVSRGLEPADAEAWDGWAAAGLEQAKAELGERFEVAHGVAPPWRFVARADGGSWRAGVLAPSADGAGRRFFVLLAAEGLSAVQAGALGANVAEHLEAVLYAAFAEELDADETLHRVGQVLRIAEFSSPAAEVLGAAPAASVWWTLGGSSHEADLIAVDRPGPHALVRMLTPAADLAQEEAA